MNSFDPHQNVRHSHGSSKGKRWSQMKCIVCSSATEPHCEKNFVVSGLDTVLYMRCVGCGFVFSETHRRMLPQEWAKLNEAYHQGYQGRDSNSDDPRWRERIRLQAAVLDDLVLLGLLRSEASWLDYACGDGALFDLVRHDGVTKHLHDEFMSRDGYLTRTEIERRKYDLVVTTSVFEHLTERHQLDFIDSLVDSRGVMALHTLVSERVPDEPSWFYFLPVHTAFFTNESMRILFKDWQYRASLYNVESRLWFLFKDPPDDFDKILQAANSRVGRPRYSVKSGFVDYWK
jgi:hypothetical protein